MCQEKRNLTNVVDMSGKLKLTVKIKNFNPVDHLGNIPSAMHVYLLPLYNSIPCKPVETSATPT
jgi:hypothetical protein